MKRFTFLILALSGCDAACEAHPTVGAYRPLPRYRRQPEYVKSHADLHIFGTWYDTGELVRSFAPNADGDIDIGDLLPKCRLNFYARPDEGLEFYARKTWWVQRTGPDGKMNGEPPKYDPPNPRQGRRLFRR